jgi:hypothetical protein
MNIKSVIQKWLEIKEPKNYDESLKDAVKEFKDETDKLETEMWKHRTVLKKKITEICPVCTKGLTVWPLESEAYYQRDGKVYHTNCYENRK